MAPPPFLRGPLARPTNSVNGGALPAVQAKVGKEVRDRPKGLGEGTVSPLQ